MKFAFIHAEGAKLPTGLLCRALKVSRSGFYAWTKRPPSRRDVEDSKLVPVIRACHAQSRATYGSPRVHKDLQALSYRVSRKRVARLMRREGLSGRPPRRYRATTDSKHSLAIAPNVVAREFHAAAPNRVWVTDMTYIWTWEGWLFLAAIVDVFSRRVVGWAMADHLRTELPLEALGMALGMRQPERGLVHRRPWPTKAEAKAAIHDYIGAFFNPYRRHSSLGYVSPMDFERQHAAGNVAA